MILGVEGDSISVTRHAPLVAAVKLPEIDVSLVGCAISPPLASSAYLHGVGPMPQAC